MLTIFVLIKRFYISNNPFCSVTTAITRKKEYLDKKKIKSMLIVYLFVIDTNIFGTNIQVFD